MCLSDKVAYGWYLEFELYVNLGKGDTMEQVTSIELDDFQGSPIMLFIFQREKPAEKWYFKNSNPFFFLSCSVLL